MLSDKEKREYKDLTSEEEKALAYEMDRNASDKVAINKSIQISQENIKELQLGIEREKERIRVFERRLMEIDIEEKLKGS